MRPRTLDVLAEPATHDLSAPYNWCDRRCERCPLAPGCTVSLVSERSRHREIVAGRDPDSIDSICTQVEEQLRAAIELLEAECRERGIDLTDLDGWERTAPCEELEARASEFVMALHGMIDCLRGDPRVRASMGLAAAEVDAISSHGFIIGEKCGRVGSYLTEDGSLDDEVATFDGAPNLLLIEYLMKEVDECIPVKRLPRRAAAYVTARDDLRQSLEPLIAAVPASCRAHLAELVRLGRAPSPFSTVTLAT